MKALCLLSLFALGACGGSPTAPARNTPPAGPPWSQSGTGNNVVTFPGGVHTVQITGHYPGDSSNFIVDCIAPVTGPLFVNDLLGTHWGRASYTGVHALQGCTQVQIEQSTGVAWTFTEVR